MASPKPVPTEAIALGLTVLFLLCRTVFECHETLHFLGQPIRSLSIEQVRALCLHWLLRPIHLFSVLFGFALVYGPLALLQKGGHLFATKTGDLTRGSIAKGDLDG